MPLTGTAFPRTRLASVLGLEGHDAVFDLTAPLRIFFAQLVRDPVDLKTFELTPLIEFVAGAITEFFHVYVSAPIDRFFRRTVSP
jgi:hypothetical protein